MERIVFTNGCFDILHPGHVELLKQAKSLGDRLIVGINSDSSVRSIKGNGRPFFNQTERANMLLALASVDEVVIFEELTPEHLIHKINPAVLVKGGDWTFEQIVGADFVLKSGGEVHSIPVVDGYSSSNIVERIQQSEVRANNSLTSDLSAPGLVEHLRVFERMLAELGDHIQSIGALIKGTFEQGNKILIFGNGGSAADAQHIAAEFVGRYERERRALPAIALTTDTSALTALGNDYGFERVYSRQIEALANEGDLLIAISTSGSSPNILAGVMTGRSKGCKVVGMTGSKGKKLASLCDAVVMVPSERAARIQECHIAIAHHWCEMLDADLK